MHRLSRAWGCASIVPSPSVSLTAAHNDGIEVSADVWWTHYYDFGSWPQFLSNLPNGMRSCETTTNKADPEEMKAWISAPLIGGCELKVMSILLEDGMFWGATSKMVEHATSLGPRIDKLFDRNKPWQHGSPEHFNLKFDLGKWNLSLAKEVTDLRVRATSELLGTEPYVSVHIRRGDYAYAASGSWADCTAPPIVVANTVRLRWQTEMGTGLPIDSVFIATDERDSAYIAELHDALQVPPIAQRGRFSLVLLCSLNVPRPPGFLSTRGF